MAPTPSGIPAQKKPAWWRAGKRKDGFALKGDGRSGTEAGGLDQTDLVATCREFTTLVALHDNTATRFHADHPGANPTESGGFENLDHITGL